MNPSIQWEEDWFTITPSDQEHQEHQEHQEQINHQEQDKDQEQVQSNHQEQDKDQNQEQDKNQEQAQEQIQDLSNRLEQLSLLVQAQSEQIILLRRELRELREREQPHTAANDIAALLEELKRVKERELNLALRCHQPVPFFDSGMLQRIVPYHNLFRTTATKL